MKNFRFPQIERPAEHIGYFLLPYKRNQDRIHVFKDYLGSTYTACVVDGWNNQELLPGSKRGQEAAEFVIQRFPRYFLTSSVSDFSKRAQDCAKKIDEQLLQRFPRHVACVGTFLFRLKNLTVIVSMGTITPLVFYQGMWQKPSGIGEYKLDWQKKESGSATFFGRGELKNMPSYSCFVDTVTYNSSLPVLILTDGVDDVMDIQSLLAFLSKESAQNDILLLKKLRKMIWDNQSKQRDDISILLAL